MEVVPGKRLDRSECTIIVFQKLTARLRKDKSPALAEALRAVALMELYTRTGGPRITWGEVVKKEAEKAAKKAKT